MPRRKVVVKRDTLPDPKFNSKLVAKFINCLMLDGKKSLAESILYKSFDLIRQRANEEPLAIFRKALNNVKPLLEVKS
ncbi:MAG: 30S ribosomal protein S7, partial [Candidatus Zixiibacteriota bacterium]